MGGPACGGDIEESDMHFGLTDEQEMMVSTAARFVSGQVIAVEGRTFNPDPAV